ncbi:Modification methylase DpnIIA [subsurface metagenome]
MANGHEINSPFRYAGGKFYARRLILQYFPQHSHYIEPLAGGASLFFAKPKVEYNWLNDTDSELMNCFLIIRDRPDELIERLDGEVASKERHGYYKNEFVPQTDLDRAVRWFYLNRTSYSGIMNMQNCFWGYGDKYSMRPENWPRNIHRTCVKLQDVILTSYDFERVVEEAEDGSFLFIDPPYYSTDQDKFYTHTFSKDDHLRLCNLLRRYSNRLKFLITYDNSPEIRALYDWANEFYEEEWNYTINRTDDQKNGTNRKGTRYKGRELFILNYDFTSQHLNLVEPVLANEPSE